MVDAMIVRWIGGRKVPGYPANRIATLLSSGVRAFRSDRKVLPWPPGAANANGAGPRSEAATKMPQQNVNDNSRFNARPKRPATRDQIRQGATRRPSAAGAPVSPA